MNRGDVDGWLQNYAYACIVRASDHTLDIIGEVLMVEMAMGVDKHKGVVWRGAGTEKLRDAKGLAFLSFGALPRLHGLRTSTSMTLHPRAKWLLRVLVVSVPTLALLPFGRLVVDWVAFARVVEVPLAQLPPRGFDWVRWQDRDGEIVAVFVDPRGTAYQAGLREGATLFQLAFQQYFSAEDIKRVIERSCGTTLTYEVTQDDEDRQFEITISRYPAFLYPLSHTLWLASGWGYALVTFLHVLALLIVVPLAGRSRRALSSSILIGAALVWVGGTFVRFLVVAVAGPPELASQTLGELFTILTLVSLAGWLLFPVLLLRHILVDADAVRRAVKGWRLAMYAPPTLLGVTVIVATIRGSLGPIPPEALTTPILFYVCIYVVAATGLMLMAPTVRAVPDAEHPAPGWSRAGSAIVFLLALVGALFVYGALPDLTGENDAAAGSIIVLLQLFSVAPVSLVSLASLRYGRFSYVLTRGFGYAAALGLIFFAFVGGLAVIETISPPEERRNLVLLGTWVVVLLVIVDRLARPLRNILGDRFRTDRERARQKLNQFGDRVRTILDAERLAHESVLTIGEALDIRSAVLFLRAGMGSSEEHWVQATFKPEPPFFTRAELAGIWSQLQEEDRVWSANSELNESRLPEEDEAILRNFGVALAVPVSSGRGEPVGVLVLGRKAHRRSVYNLEDVEMLKALCGQLAVASERLGLIEREKALVRESAEAQLAALRAQINPHFLFNALNTIAALITEKPEEAEDTVQQLAGLFRYVLQTGSRTFVPLSEELRLVSQYLRIERARFGDKLLVEEAWDHELDHVSVPAFAVQTLVENAVKHGIERKRGGGVIRLSSKRGEDGAVEITVSDTGVGIPALFADISDSSTEAEPAPAFFGIGLRNVADRLEQHYGRADLLEMTSDPDRGTVVRLTLPPETSVT